jgi:predicted 2-oxoglutarate/Fe(II)-dependent dioxygenase YbiX
MEPSPPPALIVGYVKLINSDLRMTVDEYGGRLLILHPNSSELNELWSISSYSKNGRLVKTPMEEEEELKKKEMDERIVRRSKEYIIYDPTLEGIGNAVVRKVLGPKFVCRVMKILLYDVGDQFMEHVDAPHLNMTHKLILISDIEYEGGELIVGGINTSDYLTKESNNPDSNQMNFIIFKDNCPHRINPVTSGQRIVYLFNIYNMMQPSAKEIADASPQDLVTNVSITKSFNETDDMILWVKESFPSTMKNIAIHGDTQKIIHQLERLGIEDYKTVAYMMDRLMDGYPQRRQMVGNEMVMIQDKGVIIMHSEPPPCVSHDRSLKYFNDLDEVYVINKMLCLRDADYVTNSMCELYEYQEYGDEPGCYDTMTACYQRWVLINPMPSKNQWTIGYDE